jgi:hypothetical protein
MADSDKTPDNEIMAAAKTAKQAARRSATGANPPAESKRWPMATVAGVAGIGIGSAALAAALIYNRGTAKKKD